MSHSANAPPPSRPSLLWTLEQHYDELVRYIWRRFGDHGFARDVVHDVCLQLLEKPERPGADSPLALLRRISHNTAVDRCRREDRRRAWNGEADDHDSPPTEAPDAMRMLGARQELDLLSAAIASMPPRRQQVFVMHKIHGLTQAEVAERLGVSVKMVEKQIRLGMLACRKGLER